jgi:hypothetical protein
VKKCFVRHGSVVTWSCELVKQSRWNLRPVPKVNCINLVVAVLVNLTAIDYA